MKRLLWLPVAVFFISLLPFSPSFAGPLKRPISFQHVTQKEGLSSNMVISIGVKGEEIWFGTYAGGATLYDTAKKSFKAYTTKGEPMDPVDDGVSINWKNLLPYNHVTVTIPDADRIWFGTYFYGFKGGGISYYHPQKTPPWKTFNTNNDRAKKVNAIALDGELLYVGSEKGLSFFDRKTEEWRRFYSTQDGLSGNFVNSILVQADHLWMGTSGGISRFQKSKRVWKTYSQKEGLTEIEIKSLARFGDRIWAGGTGGALFEYDSATDRWKRVEPTDPLKDGGIQSITATKDRVFVCRDNGVSIHTVSTGYWESLTTADGLLSNNVFCAGEDRNGIWFGTDKGASRLVLTPR